MRRHGVLGAAVVLGLALALPAEGQFGRNKVQYRSFDFEILRTEHFDLHYYPEEREAALDAARMAERSYARLSRLLRHEFRDRKPLIVYASHAHFQQTNALPGLIGEGTGGVTEALKSRVILPFTGSYSDFDHVLTHELVHAFQFDVLFRDGFLAATGQAGPRIPLWFLEGMAEYLAIGRIDPHTASWVRDAVLKGYIRSIPEMNRRDDYLSYRFGQSLWAYIGATWGDEVVGILLQKAPRVGVERALASTLGVTSEELSDRWIESLRSRHLPALARHDDPGPAARRLTGRRALADPWYLAPALSPDGEDLVVASQRDGYFVDLWLADGRTGAMKEKLVTGSRSAGFESLRYQSSAGSFSPDGRMVAFAAQSGGRDVLYLYDVERRRVWRRLTFDLAGIRNPSWAPDGRRLVFSGLDGGVTDLFVTDLEGRLTRLTRDRYADLHPAWSPDGRTIAFTTDRGPAARLEVLEYGNFRVALLDPTTGTVEVLPHQDEGKNINPVWSPDGHQLAWVSDRTGVNNLYLFDRRTLELRQLTDALTGLIGTNHLTPVLTWARGADRIVFVHFEAAGYTLYALDDPRGIPPLRRWGPPAVASRGGGGAPPVTGPAAGSGPALVAEPPGVPADAPDPGTPAAASVDTASVDTANVDTTGVRTARAEPGEPGEPGDGFSASYYRDPGGLRPSATLPPGAGAASGPLSVRELLDRADFTLPDTARFELLDYTIRLTPDVIARPSVGVQAGGYYGNGVYGGSYISLSDMLGDHNVVLAANVNGSLSDAMFYGGYGRFRGRTNLGLSLQQVPYYRYRGLRSFPLDVDGEVRDVTATVYLRDVVRSANATLSYPFSAFRRLELRARAAYFRRDNLYLGYFTDDRRPLEHEETVGDLVYGEPSVALVFDDALFGWTGPVDGRRYRLQLSRTAGDVEYTEALVDVRSYWSWRHTIVLAARGVALVRTGRDSDRFSLFWGGPYFIRGYDGHSFGTGSAECSASQEAAAGSLSRCPVRDQLIGGSGAFFNTEVRFPVITELRLGFLGRFPPVDGVVFFDGGLAWDERVCSTRDFDPTRSCAGEYRDVDVVWRRAPGQDPYLVRAPVYSWGVGLRMNIFYAILRLDYAFPLDRDRGGIFSLAFGPSF